jgi:hypothetical protein
MDKGVPQLRRLSTICCEEYLNHLTILCPACQGRLSRPSIFESSFLPIEGALANHELDTDRAAHFSCASFSLF